jgi:ABC-2 type transport system ATP-binding protein
MIPAIEIIGAQKRFGSLQAVDQVNLRVEQGEFFALLGPNGAGKTTLINLLSGLSRPDGGTLKVMGYDVVREYRQSRRNMGVVPQELVFDPFFTVMETLRIQSGYFGIRDNDEWILYVLERLQLADKAHSNLRTLSGGMKRRVLIAQALVHRPLVIVLDEPTAGVDVELRRSLWTFFRELNSDGHTVLLTTHYLEEVESLCRRVAILRRGQIVALDSVENLIEQSGEGSFESAFVNLTNSGEEV